MSTLWILPMPTANSMSGRPTRLLVSTSILRESSCTRDHSSFDLNFSDLFPKCRAREKVQRKEKLQWLRRWRRLHLSIQKSSFRQKCGRWGMSKYIISIWNVTISKSFSPFVIENLLLFLRTGFLLYFQPGTFFFLFFFLFFVNNSQIASVNNRKGRHMKWNTPIFCREKRPRKSWRWHILIGL